MEILSLLVLTYLIKKQQRNEKGNEGNAVHKNAKPIRQYFH